MDAERNGEPANYSGPIPQIAFNDIMLGFNVYGTCHANWGGIPETAAGPSPCVMYLYTSRRYCFLFASSIKSCGIKVNTIEL